MKISSIGTNADSEAKVDISKVHGGYFSDPKNTKIFNELGIAPLLKDLPDIVKYVDFGGGQGYLTTSVKQYIEGAGKKVDAIVADANQEYLNIAAKSGLATRLCNLEDADFSGLDLVTMRAVLHYNSPSNQLSILKNISKSLKDGGYLVHQNSSGNKENCALRSAIVNIPELGRVGTGNYHWVCEDEYIDSIKRVGFASTISAGYAPTNSWGPDEPWDRFNSEKMKTALANGDKGFLSSLESRKKIYLEKAYNLIQEYGDKYDREYVGINELPNGKIVIKYLYPITISRK